MRRTLIIVLAATLAAMIAPPESVVAMSAGNCDAGTQKSMHVIVTRASTTYDAVAGDAYAFMLHPCTPGGKYSFPAVLPANIQGSGATQIVQAGYLKCWRAGGAMCGQNVPSDGKIHFVITGADNCSGCFQKADAWAGLPILGHRYRFRVTSTSTTWTYCIRDLTDDLPYKCEPGGQAATWTAGNQVWWGTETRNTASLMGPKDPQAIVMTYMQYSKTADPNWTVTTDSTIAKSGVPHPGAYHNFLFDNDYNNDGLESHTD